LLVTTSRAIQVANDQFISPQNLNPSGQIAKEFEIQDGLNSWSLANVRHWLPFVDCSSQQCHDRSK
jgi:hypothetical protein